MPALITGVGGGVPVSGTVYQLDLRSLGRALHILRKMPVDLQRKGLRKSMSDGARIVRNAAVAGYKSVDRSETDTAIYKNLTVQFASRTSKRIDGVVMRVGIRGGAKQYGNTKENVRKGRVGKTYKTGGDRTNPGGDTWYWRFIEFGVPSRGIARRDFMLKALEQNAQQATDVIARGLNREVDSYIVRNRL